MKKILSIILSITMILSLLPLALSASAAESDRAVVTVDDVNYIVNVGEVIHYIVSFTYPKEKLATAQVQIPVDFTILEGVSENDYNAEEVFPAVGEKAALFRFDTVNKKSFIGYTANFADYKGVSFVENTVFVDLPFTVIASGETTLRSFISDICDVNEYDVATADGRIVDDAFVTTESLITGGFPCDAPKITSVSNIAAGVSLAWGAVDNAKNYAVLRKTAKTDWTVLAMLTTTSFVDATAVSGTTYNYMIRCISADGTAFLSAPDETTAVSATFYATPVLKKIENVVGGVKITWAAVPGVANYAVFTKISGKWTKLGNTTAVTFTDKTAVSGTARTYTVRCLSADKKSYVSAFDTKGLTITYIAAPALPKLENVYGGVKVTWTKVTGAAKYRVFRKTASSGWAKVADTTALTVTDKTAKNNTAYFYTVRCLSKDAKSYTSSFNATGSKIAYYAAPALSAVANTTAGVKVTWGKVAGVAKYRVFRKTAKTGWAKVGDSTTNSFVDKSAKSGTAYTYTVRCLSKDAKSYISTFNTTGKSITYIAAPVISKLQSTKTGVKVTWGKVTGAAKYRVFRKTGSSSWVKVADTTALTVTDKTAKNGVKYTYAVRCLSANGKSFTSDIYLTGKTITYKK